MTDAKELVAQNAATKVTSFMDPTVWGQMKAMAETLRQSGMLPKGLDTVPKILVVMQTGFENGLKPMESLHSLFVVNGMANYWGKAVTRRFREHGWKIQYENETADSVTAVVTNAKDEKEVYRETYTYQEAVKSGYTTDNYGKLKVGWKEGYNRRLKLRYGALNIIIKSYIPEIYGSAQGMVEVEEDVVYEDAEVVRDEPTAPKATPNNQNLDDFMEKTKKQTPKKTASEPVKEEAVEGEVVQETSSSEDRKKLERRYFALLKELGSDHATAKSLFGFEHLKDLTDKQLIDIVGELSRNRDNSTKGN